MKTPLHAAGGRTRWVQSLLHGALFLGAVGLVGRPLPTTAAEGRRPMVTLETTQGTITLELYPEDAPKAVEHFLTLARREFYNGLLVHRVIPGFMIQTGDPTGTGRGGPGYTFEDEISPRLRHDGAGVVSMANAGPNTNGSQFFITLAATPWLDGHHTIFGRVLQGQEVVAAIAAVPRDANDRPLTDVTMRSVTVHDDGPAGP